MQNAGGGQIEPGESRQYNLEFGVLDNAEEIAEVERIIDAMRGSPSRR